MAPEYFRKMPWLFPATGMPVSALSWWFINLLNSYFTELSNTLCLKELTQLSKVPGLHLYLFQWKFVQRQLLHLKMTCFQMACWDRDDLLSILADDSHMFSLETYTRSQGPVDDSAEQSQHREAETAVMGPWHLAAGLEHGFSLSPSHLSAVSRCPQAPRLTNLWLRLREEF